MLQTIRDKTQGWIASVIIGLVCITFALVGAHYYMQGNGAGDQNIAKVNGQPISAQQFNVAFQRMQQQQQAELGADYSNDVQFQQELRKELLQQMLEQQAILHTVQKKGFVISQDRINKLLLNIPAFQINGRFSVEQFTMVVNRLMYTPQQFNQQLHDQLLVAQLATGINDSGFSLPVDVRAAIRLLNENRDIGYMVLPIAKAIQNSAITEEQIKTYYQQHQQDFNSAAAVQLEYVLLKPQANDEKGQQKFAEQAEKMASLAYENPNSLQSIVKTLHLPLQTTEYVTRDNAEQKGILGSPHVIASAFSDEVLNQHYNSDSIRLDDGSQVVIRVAHYKAAKPLPLPQVKNTIKQLLSKNMAQEQLLAQGEMLAAKIAKGEDPQLIAKQFQTVWKEKQDVNRHQENIDPGVLQSVFNLEVPLNREHPTSKAIVLPNGNLAIVAFYAVEYGDLTKVNADEYNAFRTRIAMGYGQIDYRLYVYSLMKKAKITLGSVDNSLGQVENT